MVGLVAQHCDFWPHVSEKDHKLSFGSAGFKDIERHDVVPPDALAEQIQAWNATRTEYPRDRSVAQLFEEIVSAFPGSVALVFGNERITFAELNARGNRLACRLRDEGVGPETLVGCCFERSIELIVGLVAVLKAGGAYVPIDPAYPKERFDFLLQDTQTKLMLTQQSLVSTVLSNYRERCLVVDETWSIGPDPGNPSPAGGPDSLAYVMYTSGSTGRPKGVMVENRPIVRLVRNSNFCSFGPDEVFLHFAPISFDASTLEIWGALLNGGRLVIMKAGPTSLSDLIGVIREQRVTTLWLTAGLFNLMAEENLKDLGSLRQFLAGGDVLSPRHVRRVLEQLPDCCLINGYGPTENTTFTCCHPMRINESVPEPVPIGRPISNTQVYILDDDLGLVAPGAVGELYAAGDGLARGYLNDPDATAQKFLPNPFAREDRNARMYRTGDLARWRSDGVVEFLGRADDQVKILGHRIEPGEIEAALCEHSDVRESCVVALPDKQGSKRLAAYYTSFDGESSVLELRKFLSEKLPEFMIPTFFVHTKSLPLTPNGKVDRVALVSLGVPSRATAVAERAKTALENTIFDVWRECLGLQQFGMVDNFFDLGGDSLLLVTVHASLEKSLQKEIPITALFEFATIRALAEYLSGKSTSGHAVQGARERAKRQRAAFSLQKERRSGSV